MSKSYFPLSYDYMDPSVLIHVFFPSFSLPCVSVLHEFFRQPCERSDERQREQRKKEIEKGMEIGDRPWKRRGEKKKERLRLPTEKERKRQDGNRADQIKDEVEPRNPSRSDFPGQGQQDDGETGTDVRTEQKTHRLRKPDRSALREENENARHRGRTLQNGGHEYAVEEEKQGISAQKKRAERRQRAEGLRAFL